MNAIIEMTNDGIICKDCGNFIDGEAPGYERNCGCIEVEQPNNDETSFVEKIKDLLNSNK